MTLIEALVVVAITAMITAIGFVSFRADGEAAAWRATSAALVESARRARAEAVRTDRTAALEVAADGRSFTVAGGAPITAAAGARVIAEQDIVFFTDGSSSGGAVLLTDGTRSATMTVDAVTGAIGLAQGAAR